MKLLSLSLLAALLPVGLVSAQPAPPALPAADLAAIRAVLKHQHDNLNDHKFSEMPTYVTPDVTTINIVGMWWQGEPEVQYGHQAVFDRIYQDAKFNDPSAAPPTLRAITPEVVLVTQRGAAPARSDLPPGTPSPLLIGTTLLVKRGGRWLITAFQNTIVDPQAAKNDPVAMRRK